LCIVSTSSALLRCSGEKCVKGGRVNWGVELLILSNVTGGIGGGGDEVKGRPGRRGGGGVRGGGG